MLQVVAIHIRVQRDALEIHFLVILRARQRRQDEELQDIDRQLALDDLDVALDAFRSIAGKAQDIAGRVMTLTRARPATSSRYSAMLVLTFLAASRFSGLMFSSPMKTARQPARAAFSMKLGILWQSVSTWMMKLRYPLLLAQLDEPVEDRFPVLVAGEIVVGDEEAIDALRRSRARALRRRPRVR